jgi:hypothetical protein
MNSKRPRCAGVAFANRHDHANGTLTIRPSARPATMASSVTSKVTMRGSLLATVLIPCLPNAVQIVNDDFPDSVQFLCRKAIVIRRNNGFKPEFANNSVPAHMDVRPFVTVEAVKEKPMGA